MRHTIEFKQESNLGTGQFIDVVVDTVSVGKIVKDNLGRWCFMSKQNTLNPDLVGSDLTQVKALVTALYSR